MWNFRYKRNERRRIKCRRFRPFRLKVKNVDLFRGNIPLKKNVVDTFAHHVAARRLKVKVGCFTGALNSRAELESPPVRIPREPSASGDASRSNRVARHAKLSSSLAVG